MWERFRDKHHRACPHPIRRTFPENREPGTEGQCHAIYAGTNTTIAVTPCTKPAHHLGLHTWEPMA